MFTAPPIIAPAVLGDLMDAVENIDKISADKTLTQRQSIDAAYKAFDEVFGFVLMPESASRFHNRLYSRDDPLSWEEEVMPALIYLIEEYTGRPLEQSSSSAGGLTGSGTFSTSGASPEESTPSTSPPTDSAT